MGKARIVNGFLAVALALAMLFGSASVFAEGTVSEGEGSVGAVIGAEAAGESVGAAVEPLPTFTTALHKTADGDGKIAESDEIKLETNLFFVIKKDVLSDIAVDNEYIVTLAAGIKAPVSTGDFQIRTIVGNKEVIFAL